MKKDWLYGLILLGSVLLFSKLWRSKWIRDGIDKKEFVALVFLGILLSMHWKDSHRTHEWSHFSDLQYLMCYVFISVGLGLNEIIDAIYAFRGVTRKETKVEIKEETIAEPKEQ